MFKQAVDLDAITIECKWPLVLEIDFDSVYPMHVEPPMTRVVIERPKDIEDRGVLNFRNAGYPIEIRKLRFTGRPPSLMTQSTSSPSRSGADRHNDSHRLPVEAGPKLLTHRIRLMMRFGVHGIRFSEFRDIREVYLVYDVSRVRKA
jgi:hypothetical protein